MSCFDVVDDAVDEGVRQPLFDGAGRARLRPFRPSWSLAATVSAKVTSRSVASGRRLKRTSSTCWSSVFVDLFVDGDLAGVDDPHVEAGLDGVVQEGRVHRLADRLVAAEGERHVAHAAGGLRAGTGFLNLPHAFDEFDGVVGVLFDPRADGEDVGVEDHVFRCEADLFGQQAEGPLGDGRLAVGRDGLPLFVEGHHDGGRPVTADEPRLPQELGFAFFQADRIDDAFALHALEARLDHRPLRAVDHQRDAGDFGLGGDQVQERRHGLFAVEERFVHVDVEDVGAVGDLVAGDLESRFVIAAADEAGEFFRAGDVRPLADDDEIAFGPQRQRLQAAQARIAGNRRTRTRGDVFHCVGDGADVLGRRAAAAADDIEPAVLGELTQQPPHVLGRFVVAAEFVGQAGVGMAAHEAGGNPRKFLDVGPHAVGAQGAVETHAQCRKMRDRVPKGLDRLAGEGPAAGVGDRGRDHHGQVDAPLIEELRDGEQARLEVERVERRLRHQEVDATVEQGLDLLAVGGGQLVERDRAEARIVDVGRERGGAAGGADAAGDEAGLFRIRGR